jgi:hypothetical protein
LVPLKVDLDSLRRNRWIRTLAKFVNLESVAVAAGVLLAGGLINYLLIGYTAPATELVTRNTQTQSLMETFTYVIASAMGVCGVYMLSRTGGSSKAGRESSLLFVAGVLVLMAAFFLFFSFYNFKVYG